MIYKEIEYENQKYLIGFKEVGSQKDGIECHILKTILGFKRSIYHELRLKTLEPNYKEMALWTIFNYQREQESKNKLLNWNGNFK